MHELFSFILFSQINDYFSFILIKNIRAFVAIYFLFKIIIKITGTPNKLVITLIGNCESSEITEKNSIIKTPKIIFKIHCCHNFAGE